MAFFVLGQQFLENFMSKFSGKAYLGTWTGKDSPDI